MLDHESNAGMRYISPLMKTPVTDFLCYVRTVQCNKKCAPYELLYSDCMEAYGYHRGKEMCRLIYEDFHECLFKAKRLRRILAMDTERERQIKNGERKEPYTQNAPLDLY